MPSATRWLAELLRESRVAGVDGLEHLDQQSGGDFDAVGVLAWQLHVQDVALAVQTKHIQELSLTIAEQSKTNSLEQQEKCAAQAERAFKAASYTPTDHAGYENHYNKALNKCFIVMQALDIRGTPGSIFTSGQRHSQQDVPPQTIH